jgi:hypothetical protein
VGAQSDASLEGEIDALYRLPLAEFVAARNALAKRLAREGAREAAERVRALAKPNVVAWTQNQLWWRHREDVLALLQAVRELRTRAGADATRARKHALARLLERADAILHEAGHAGQVATLRRIERSLAAAAAREVPELGRLVDEVEAPGFEVLGDGFAPAAGLESNEDPERDRAQRAADEAVARQERAEDAADKASARAKVLREEATIARARLDEARAIADRAEATAIEAERAAAQASAQAQAAAAAARRLVTDKR